jgi:murein DD-endopeptidase MepM/ murein hydrolase activator NlpD
MSSLVPLLDLGELAVVPSVASSGTKVFPMFPRFQRKVVRTSASELRSHYRPSARDPSAAILFVSGAGVLLFSFLFATMFPPRVDSVAEPTAASPGVTPRQIAPAPPPQYILPTSGTITQRMKGLKHTGVDIANAVGTPIVAIADGEVIKAGWDVWGLGNVVVIEHDDGRVSVYGHNSQLTVIEGARVSRGTPIARMGSTGNSTGSHLHFEIREGDDLIDPESLIDFSSLPRNIQL